MTSRTCMTCGVSIEHKRVLAKYCSIRCGDKSPQRKAARQKYNQSPERKAVAKRYRQSPQGQAVAKRYRQPPQGQAAVQRSAAQRRQKVKDTKQDNECVICGISIAHKYANAKYVRRDARTGHRKLKPHGRSMINRLQAGPHGRDISKQRKAKQTRNASMHVNSKERRTPDGRLRRITCA